MYGICTPHSNRKYELVLFRGRKTVSAPKFWSPGFHRPHIPYLYPKEFEYNGTVVFPPKDYAITRGVPYMAPHDWTKEGATYSDLKAIDPSITAHNFRKNLSSLCTTVEPIKTACAGLI